MIRWPLVGNDSQEGQIGLVAKMLFVVDHKGELDAALLSRRITYSKEVESE